MDIAIIWKRLTHIFQDVFDEPELRISAETTADHIEEWDSLMHIQLLVAIERVFGIKFNTGEVVALANVGEMVGLIAKRVN